MYFTTDLAISLDEIVKHLAPRRVQMVLFRAAKNWKQYPKREHHKMNTLKVIKNTENVWNKKFLRLLNDQAKSKSAYTV